MGIEDAFALVMKDRKPYSAKEMSAKSCVIEFFNQPSQTLRVSEFERYYRNISFREGSWAWSAISGIYERIETVRNVALAYKTQRPEVASTLEIAFDKWASRHISESKSYIARYQNMASAMVVGPSKFPASRERKKQEWADNHYTRLVAHVSAGKKRLKRIAWPYGAPGEAIRSNDPNAIDRLQRKLESLEDNKRYMKAVNAAWRSAGRPGKNSDESQWVAFSQKLDTTLSKIPFETLKMGMLSHYMADRRACPPFESYSLSNNNAEITRLKKRITSLTAVREIDKEEHFETREGELILKRNGVAHRIQLLFTDKPSPDTRKILKSAGFRWAPSEGAWQRHLNAAGLHAANRVIEKIKIAQQGEV